MRLETVPKISSRIHKMKFLDFLAENLLFLGWCDRCVFADA